MDAYGICNEIVNGVNRNQQHKHYITGLAHIVDIWGFPKIGVPPNWFFFVIFPYKPSIWVPHLWKTLTGRKTRSSTKKWLISPYIYLVAHYPRIVSGLYPSDLHGISRVNPLITGVLTHLLSGMSTKQGLYSNLWRLLPNFFVAMHKQQPTSAVVL